MSEWWTYTLSDFLLFSPRTYYRLFELYNAAIWPGQLLGIGVGLAIAALLRRPAGWRDRTIAALLAACWLWVAFGFLVTHYASINWAAPYFAAGFVSEAVLLLLLGGARPGFLEPREAGWTSRLGVGLFLFALLVQPLIGRLLGRPWTQMEIFGSAPDPTAVGTLGLLLCTSRRWELLLLPVTWCAITGATLWTMEAPDAWIAPAAALLAVGALATARHQG